MCTSSRRPDRLEPGQRTGVNTVFPWWGRVVLATAMREHGHFPAFDEWWRRQPGRLPGGARAAVPAAGLLHRRRDGGADPQGQHHALAGAQHAGHVSYPAAAAAGSLLAVCSCTIVPLFAGIYRKGAGIGPAITFLFFAPAGNIMALAYTGSILGAEFAARARRAVPAVRHRHRPADGAAVLARRRQPRRADRRPVRRAGEHRPAAGGRAAVAGGGADRRHAASCGHSPPRWPRSTCRCHGPTAWQATLFAVGAIRRRQGRRGRERAGLAADRAAVADRR